MPDELLYTLRYGHSQAAIDYRRSLALREISREYQDLWRSKIADSSARTFAIGKCGVGKPGQGYDRS